MHSRDIMEALYKSLSVCVKNIVLPVGSTLVPSVAICFVIVIITLICKAADLYTLLDYRGTLLALIILCIQCYCERRSNSDILRLYRSVRLQLEKAERRQERPSSSIDTSGDTTGSVGSFDEDRSGTESRVQVGLRGFIGSPSDSTISQRYEESDGQNEADDS